MNKGRLWGRVQLALNGRYWILAEFGKAIIVHNTFQREHGEALAMLDKMTRIYKTRNKSAGGGARSRRYSPPENSKAKR